MIKVFIPILLLAIGIIAGLHDVNGKLRAENAQLASSLELSLAASDALAEQTVGIERICLEQLEARDAIKEIVSYPPLSIAKSAASQQSNIYDTADEALASASIIEKEGNEEYLEIINYEASQKAIDFINAQLTQPGL